MLQRPNKSKEIVMSKTIETPVIAKHYDDESHISDVTGGYFAIIRATPERVDAFCRAVNSHDTLTTELEQVRTENEKLKASDSRSTEVALIACVKLRGAREDLTEAVDALTKIKLKSRNEAQSSAEDFRALQSIDKIATKALKD